MLDVRIHLFRDKEQTHRTTISMELYLFEYFAVYLGYMPDSKEARPAVAKWLQNELFNKIWYDPKRSGISQFLKMRMIEEMMDEKIKEKREEWTVKKIEKRIMDKKLSTGKERG